MENEFNIETKEEIKSHIDLQFIRLATEIKEDIENNFSKANEKIVTQQVLINTLTNRIDKAIHFLNTEYDTYSSGEEWRKALIKILNGSDKE